MNEKGHRARPRRRGDRVNRRDFFAGLEVRQRDAARWLDYSWFNFASLGADTGRH
jgi:hypothetical protein